MIGNCLRYHLNSNSVPQMTILQPNPNYSSSHFSYLPPIIKKRKLRIKISNTNQKIVYKYNFISEKNYDI